MGETRDLIGIYGAIDRVMDAPERRGPVSRLLPDYQHERARWFDEFENWTRSRRTDTSQDPFPSLDEALEGLAERPAKGRMRARRLFAIALATQAFPELLRPRTKRAGLARDALRFEDVADSDTHPQELLQLLGDEGHLRRIDARESVGRDEWWDNVALSYQSLTGDHVPLGPRPCSGRLVSVTGVSGPVATLESGFVTDAVSFDDAVKFLEPLNWPGCSDFWCEMTQLGVLASGVHEYHEVVSTDCGNKGAAWTIRAELDFRFRGIPGRMAAADYRLRDGYPKPGDDVLVDEGSLVVSQIGTAAAPMLSVTTTKRIRFNHPFSGEALALMMCALGYANVVEDLVFTCATAPGVEGGTTFPAETPISDREGAAPSFAPALVDIGEEVATAVKTCIDDWVKAAQRSSEKMAEGKYTADALFQDVTCMWARILREGATAVDVGVRSARAAARVRGREPPAS